VDEFALQLRALEASKVLLPVAPRPDRERLLPPLARIVLPRDSIEFINAQTVGDVLAEVPGLYLWRLGWVGRAELPNYLGRGATSVEYLVDGVPWVPMGPDSLSADPSLFPLGMLDRMEIEILPGQLRVHLFLRNHDRLAPRSRVTVGQGDFNQARYEFLFEKRTRAGLGLALAAEQVSAEPAERGGGTFTNTNTWIQADYVPSSRFGLMLRYRGVGTDRQPTVLVPGDTSARGIDGSRADLSGRVFLRFGAAAANGLDLTAARVRWRDTARTELWQAGLSAVARRERWSLGASVWYGSEWTRWDGRLHAGWTPTRLLTLTLEGVLQEHLPRRTGRWITARAGFDLPLGFQVAGAWRVGDVVARPRVGDDAPQELSDREATVGWNQPWAGLRVTYSHLDAFRPVPYWQYGRVKDIAPSGRTEWLTIALRLRPRPWLTTAAWYSDPLGAAPEGIPPTHSVIQAAIRSKFLRTFPSGIFDLKLAVSVESWGTGVLGRGPDGAPVQLDGATFLRGLLQMQFGGFVAYVDRTNLHNSRKSYVPGLPLPRDVLTFGVRWTFLN
jgi:hypothetical protein